MVKKVNAILYNAIDDVTTAIIGFQKNDIGRYLKNGEIIEIVVTENIPKFHKFAVRDIYNGELVRKYGEIIGKATDDISRGRHVHDHNIVSLS